MARPQSPSGHPASVAARRMTGGRVKLSMLKVPCRAAAAGATGANATGTRCPCRRWWLYASTWLLRGRASAGASQPYPAAATRGPARAQAGRRVPPLRPSRTNRRRCAAHPGAVPPAAVMRACRTGRASARGSVRRSGGGRSNRAATRRADSRRSQSASEMQPATLSMGGVGVR